MAAARSVCAKCGVTPVPSDRPGERICGYCQAGRLPPWLEPQSEALAPEATNRSGAWRTRTVSLRVLRRFADGSALSLEELAAVTRWRPRHRDDCAGAPRPCPFVACRHHLFLEVRPNGSIQFNFPGLELEQLKATCALDVAEEGGITLERVGELLALTRERTRQVEARALARLRRVVDE